MSVKLVYFAWVRERIGHPEEIVTLPASVTDVAELMGWLCLRGETYAHAFEKAALIRVAIDKVHVKHDSLLGDALEIAFFPPMTGG